MPQVLVEITGQEGWEIVKEIIIEKRIDLGIEMRVMKTVDGSYILSKSRPLVFFFFNNLDELKGGLRVMKKENLIDLI